MYLLESGLRTPDPKRRVKLPHISGRNSSDMSRQAQMKKSPEDPRDFPEDIGVNIDGNDRGVEEVCGRLSERYYSIQDSEQRARLLLSIKGIIRAYEELPTGETSERHEV